MSLEELKNSWQKMNQFPPTEKEELEEIIKADKKTAIEKLIRTEYIMLVADLLTFAPLALVHSINQLLFAIFLAVLIFIIPWQIYKISFLKKINIAQMEIIEVHKRIKRYRVFILSELYSGLACIVFILIFFITESTFNTNAGKVCMISFLIALSLIIYIIYYKSYFKHIKTLKNSK